MKLSRLLFNNVDEFSWLFFFSIDFPNASYYLQWNWTKREKEKKGERDDSTKITFSKMGVRIVHVIFMIDDRMQRVIYLVWREVIVRLFHVPRATTGRYDFPVENTVADTSEHVTAWLTWKNDNK